MNRQEIDVAVCLDMRVVCHRSLILKLGAYRVRIDGLVQLILDPLTFGEGVLRVLGINVLHCADRVANRIVLLDLSVDLQKLCGLNVWRCSA
ncbi:MAG: hypothetical protein J0H69_11120 [Burkholderiales bacterium]|nr:hypothetical protein [Burkholderiales bacterium]